MAHEKSNEFFDPKSTLTPAIAASLVVFVSASLYKVFPEIEFRYLAVSLSFLFGAVVTFGKINGKLSEAIFYWLVNSVVIFSIGVGAGQFESEIRSDDLEEYVYIEGSE